MFDWYIVGTFIFYIMPYYLGRMGYFEFQYYPLKDESIVSWGLLIILFTVTCGGIGYVASNKLVNSFVKVFLVFKPIQQLIKPLTFLITIIIFLIVAKIILAMGLSSFSNNMVARDVLASFGPYVIFLQIPLGVSLYLWGEFIKEKRKRIFIMAIVFTLMAITTAFIRGQRTDLILIFLLPAIALYAKNKSFIPIVTSFIIAISFAAWYAITFKASYMLSGESSFFKTIGKIIGGDFDRNWTLWMALENTSFISSNFLPYFGSGYVYTLFAFVPRALAPFKGFSTEGWFTIHVAPLLSIDSGAIDVSQLSWGYVFGVTVESILNFGWIGILIVGFMQGFILRLLNKISQKHISVYAISTLLCINMNGYSLFNSMIIIVPVLITLILLIQKNEKPLLSQ
ncbi:O-antigen polymerase [Paenisporosarcina sp. NPDC076898]